MTTQNPAIFLQAGSHPAEDTRRFIAGTVPFHGVRLTDDLKVTERSGTANMSVDVAGGRAFINGTEATYQGTYFVENRGVQNVVVSAAHATLARIDLIVAKVQDAGYSGATNAWSLAVVAGTPAASPAAPTAPANSLVLARVAVAALATTVVNANITDYRYITAGQSIATAAGGTIICNSTTRPATPNRGTIIFETDTGNTLSYYGATTGWRQPWGDPWGYVTSATITANSTAVSALTDVTGLSVSASYVLNRRYKLSWVGEAFCSVGDGAYVLYITNSGGTVIARNTALGVSCAAGSASGFVTVIETATSTAATTRKVQIAKISGTGTVLVGAGTTFPSILLVEDIGPATSTAPTS